ncbi:hypothetical protein HPB49_025411 [Dermacentor silvarum]|uniref:Uncharacterized protein n=2 Tax=Dermacentor silvarum TaxID=543639 RepID=A0ACB8E2I6_DERSI|nr:hypothetical protein HPB49_021619 [Dermacentor silvarum]KAH7981562.1 hypothetical protein HPB49_025411 [Dermacentor silvarum]
MYGMVSSQSGGKGRSMRRHQLSRQRTSHSLGGAPTGGSPRATPGCSGVGQPTASPARSLSHRGGQHNVYGRLVGFLKHTWTGFTMAVAVTDNSRKLASAQRLTLTYCCRRQLESYIDVVSSERHLTLAFTPD